MKHPSNRDLFAYWNERRGQRDAPTRADIDPAAIRQVLGDTFVLEVDAAGQYPFRLAGTRLCALFGRELKGESFLKLWQHTNRADLRELLVAVVDERTGVVASASGSATDDKLLAVHLELVLLPLASSVPREARLLGALAPMAAPYWLGAKAIEPLTLGTFRHIGAASEVIGAPRFTPSSGRVKHGLTVYEGGRVD